jgi:ADP-heptose:LPS heptosyltransferase
VKAGSKYPVVFFSNGLGDTILALPALRALQTLFGPALKLICDAGPHELILSELRVKKIPTVMRRNIPDWTREFDVDKVAAEIGQCDFFISLVPWESVSLKRLLDRLSPAESIGLFADYTICVPRDFTKHAADLSFDIPKRLDASLRFEDFCEPPRLSSRSRKIAERVRKLIPADYRILAVHADTGANKMWPPERFVEVLDCFLERHRDIMCLVVGSARQPLDGGRHGDRVVPCYGLALDASMRIVELADIFLGVDSSMLHAADFFRIPSVGLFGGTSPVEFGFRVTPIGTICKGKMMDCIRTEEVLGALEDVVSAKTSLGAAGMSARATEF